MKVKDIMIILGGLGTMFMYIGLLLTCIDHRLFSIAIIGSIMFIIAIPSIK